jgi:hypothetical protein
MEFSKKKLNQWPNPKAQANKSIMRKLLRPQKRRQASLLPVESKIT